MTNRQRFNPNWDRAIIALVQHKTCTAAAKALGIDRATLYRYMKIPEFHAQLQRTLAFVKRRGRAKLQAQSVVAADYLTQVLNDPKAKTGIRVRVAKFIINRPSTRLSLDDLQLEDFFLDPAELDSAIPRLNRISNGTARVSTIAVHGNGRKHRQTVVAASPEDLARLEKLAQAVVAARGLAIASEPRHEFPKKLR